MNNHDKVSALAYLSMLFLPVVVPIIIYFVMKEKDVRYHCKRALLSQLIPFALGAIILGVLFLTTGSGFLAEETITIGFFVFAILLLVTIAIISIWNILQVLRLPRLKPQA